MNVLVVGSCTGAKDDGGCPNSAKLTSADFDDPLRLRKQEDYLADWVKPAAQLYKGRQHTQMMDGVRILRSLFGPRFCDVAIVSAGYGLVEENRPLAPYDVTFHGMPKPLIRARGETLEIPARLRKLTSKYQVVFFLLGDDYLLSAHPPLIPSDAQRFIAFGSAKLRQVPGGSVTIIPATQKEASEFSDGVVTLKGRLFSLLAAGLQRDPTRWAYLLRKNHPDALLNLIRLGTGR